MGKIIIIPDIHGRDFQKSTYLDVLISHAGVHQDWLIDVFYSEMENVEDIIKIPIDKIHDDLNKLLEDEDNLIKSLYVVGINRGDYNFYGSPVWCDVVEQWDNNLPFKQIVGHSMQCFSDFENYSWGLSIQVGIHNQVTCIEYL